MEMLSNAVLGDLVGRSVSFLLSKCEKRTVADDDLQRLHHLLLRSSIIIEEAEQRQVANRAMLRQLQALRDETFRGHYVADTVSSQALRRGGGHGGGRENDGDDETKEEASLRTFALSRFNLAKRIRCPSGDLKTAALFGGAGPRELQQMVRSLEYMIGDMEFVVFLMNYPRLHPQPYSAHLFLDKCMFGRHKEKKTIIDFLLQPEPAGTLGVLPIVGLPHIGKSTLVEHVCHDERVRRHFSSILVYSGNDLKDSSMASLIDRCLVIIELLDDVDEETWKRLYYSSDRSMAEGSKMIITSRSKNIQRFGTTQALRLDACLQKPTGTSSRCLSLEVMIHGSIQRWRPWPWRWHM